MLQFYGKKKMIISFEWRNNQNGILICFNKKWFPFSYSRALYPLHPTVLRRWHLCGRWRNGSSEIKYIHKITQMVRMFLTLKTHFSFQHIISKTFQHFLVHICLWNPNKIGNRMIMHNFLLAAWFPFGLLQLGNRCIYMDILTQERKKKTI